MNWWICYVLQSIELLEFIHPFIWWSYLIILVVCMCLLFVLGSSWTINSDNEWNRRKTFNHENSCWFPQINTWSACCCQIELRGWLQRYFSLFSAFSLFLLCCFFYLIMKCWILPWWTFAPVFSKPVYFHFISSLHLVIIFCLDILFELQFPCELGQKIIFVNEVMRMDCV